MDTGALGCYSCHAFPIETQRPKKPGIPLVRRNLLSRKKFQRRPLRERPLALWSLTVIVFAFGTTGCSTFRQKTLSHRLAAERLYHDANDLEKLGRASSAERLLQESLTHVPQNAAAHQKLSELYFARGETNLAIKQLETALDAGCENAAIHAQLGRYSLSTGQLFSAKEHSRKAIELSQLTSNVWELAGDVARAQGELSEALSAYHRAADCEDADPRVQLKVCEVYRESNRTIRALSAIEQMCTHYPSESVPQEALVLHGIVLTELKNYHQAIEQLQRAVANPDATPEAFLRLSNAQLLAGHEHLAHQTLAAGSKAFPQQTIFAELLARTPAELPTQLTARQ